MASSDSVRTAAVGIGWVSTNRHIPTMRAVGGYEIVGVVDIENGRAEEYARRHSIARWATTGNLSEVDWLDEVDAVTIGAPPFAHYELAMQALELGKHALTDKPFAMMVDQGEQMMMTAQERGLALGVVHNFQFSYSSRALIRDMDAGRFGQIRSVLAHQLSNPRRPIPSWIDELPLGLFYDESPYHFYMIDRLCSEPLELETAVSHPSTRGVSTPAFINAKYTARAGDLAIPVTLCLNFEAPLTEWHLLVHGDEATGVVDIFRDIYVRLPNDGLHKTGTVFRTSVLATWQHWAQHFTSGIRHLTGRLRYGNETIFSRFAEAVRTGTQPEGIGPEDALRVLRMQHEIMAAVSGDDAG